MPDIVTLRLQGKIYTGWQTATVTRDLTSLSGQFDLTLTDQPTASLFPNLAKPGDTASVWIGSEQVIAGYLDEITRSVESESYTVSAAGRHRLADLIDCSAIHPSGQWLNQSLEQIVLSLAGPFGVTVENQFGATPQIPEFKLTPGQTGADVLRRLSRITGILIHAGSEGQIVLSRAGLTEVSTVLEAGTNLKSWSWRQNNQQRFSSIKVLAQTGKVSKSSFQVGAQSSGLANDPGVTRYRPLILRHEGKANSASASQRAAWEVARRRAESEVLSVTVAGWRQDSGQLWDINQLVSVKIPQPGFEIDRKLLIKSVQLIQNESEGQITKMELLAKEAYSQIAGAE